MQSKSAMSPPEILSEDDKGHHEEHSDITTNDTDDSICRPQKKCTCLVVHSHDSHLTYDLRPDSSEMISLSLTA